MIGVNTGRSSLDNSKRFFLMLYSVKANPHKSSTAYTLYETWINVIGERRKKYVGVIITALYFIRAVRNKLDLAQLTILTHICVNYKKDIFRQ
jgi:hypothetical protein